jgi:SSS family solute:Na+ symporter
MSDSLAWQDHFVIAAYLLAMVGMGLYLSRKQGDAEEYFLGGRRMPWFAVGLSVIATLMSSLTYISEPGEIWRSGVVNMLGKMLAIPFEMLFVWFCCIPFLMRFRYTSVYEYLGDRFGSAARWLGVLLFSCMALAWMGLIVLASSRALVTVTGLPLELIILTVGLVATAYTVLGGFKAVVWTDVVQVVMMLGGAILAMGCVSVATGAGPLAWFETTREYQAQMLANGQTSGMQLWSLDPFVRSTMVTVALNMFVWHVSTHLGSQMAVQRYFSTPSRTAARRSFLVGSLVGVAINLLLMLLGMALLFYYVQWLDTSSPEGLNPHTRDADLIFPMFVVHQMPPGVAGAIMAAVLAAAMSSIDSGVSSLATVLAIEWRDHQARGHAAGEVPRPESNAAFHERTAQVRLAQWVTLTLGLAMTGAAFLLDRLPQQGNIIEMMPTTFNCFTCCLGGLFFVGLFVPRAGNAAAVIATLCGLATSISLGYGQQLYGLERKISFTWIMPGSLLVTILVAVVLGYLLPASRHGPGLTWADRRSSPV